MVSNYGEGKEINYQFQNVSTITTFKSVNALCFLLASRHFIKKKKSNELNELNFYDEALPYKTFCSLVLAELKRTFIMMKL